MTMTTTATMTTALHGRDAPLSVLRTALERALAGRGQLVLVSGEAGIGKSAIASEIAREAATRCASSAGARVVWGRAWEFADAPPYFPIWPCLRDLGISSTSGTADQDAFELWENVVTSLARASKRDAIVWILEDLHAADLGTLDLLTFLAQPLREMRVLVVATVRDKDPRLTDRMLQRLTRMARDGVDVRLGPLSDKDVAAITEATLARRPLPEGMLRRLVELTGGNPLFVVECARAFLTGRELEGTLGSLPTTVRQVVLDRVALLPQETRSALASAAILGREFSAASVARMDEPRSLPARVIDTLSPALRSGLITETKPGQFLFSHSLVRDAIDDALGADERATLHGRCDAALEALGGNSADVLVERARHAIAALRSRSNGDDDEAQVHALALSTRASELLEREGAFDRAFDLHTHIDDARRAGFLPRAAADEQLHYAQIARAAGRSDVTRKLCEEVIAEARVTRAANVLARAALLHGADVRIGVVDQAQVALLEETLAALGECVDETSASVLACRVLARLATALQPAPDQAVPMKMAREAIERAYATGNEAAIMDVLDQASWGLYCAPLAERTAIKTDLIKRAIGAGDSSKILSGYAVLAFHHVEAGDFDAFDRDVDNMLALSDGLGHPRARWRPLLFASMRATMRGHFVESEEYVTEVTQLAALVDDTAFGLAFGNSTLMRKRFQRLDDDVRMALADLESLMSDVTDAALYSAFTRAACTARVRDVRATREALAVIGGRMAFLASDPMSAGMLGEAYALAGTNDERRSIRDIITRLESPELAGDQMSFLYEGPTVRVLGLLDAALGDLESAAQELREAYERVVQRKQTPWMAQIAFELSIVLETANRSADARVLKDEALRIARDLGMTGLERALSAHSSSTPTQQQVAAVDVNAVDEVRFEKSGAMWTIAWGTRVVSSIKDSRGMQLLARLVERRDEEIHVLALASDDDSAASGGAAGGLPESNAGEMLDERARASYRQRLVDLEEDLAEAQRNADRGRVEALSEEREALLAELARAVGLGGRVRTAGSATERARVNVQRRLKNAMARIAELDPEVGRSLERSVRTGTFCCFRLHR